MLLKGTLYVTYDINLCLTNLNMCKTIVIADDPDTYNIPGKIGGSLLMPPYEAMASIVDGDDVKFRYDYLNYLTTNPTVNKFIDIILQALIAGTNIIFLLESEGPNFEIILKEYFMINFGIFIGDASNPFKFDIKFTPMILNRLYAEDNISKESYLTMYPQEIPFDQFIIHKLSYEYGIRFNNEYEASGYFKKQSLILKNGGAIQGIVKRLG